MDPSEEGGWSPWAGDPTDPLTFYFGATAGGVWKSTDAGMYWRNVSDGFFRTAAVGAIAVADSDPNVVYAGMGEACIRHDSTHGDGVYGSVDGGSHLDAPGTGGHPAHRPHPRPPQRPGPGVRRRPWGTPTAPMRNEGSSAPAMGAPRGSASSS